MFVINLKSFFGLARTAAGSLKSTATAIIFDFSSIGGMRAWACVRPEFFEAEAASQIQQSDSLSYVTVNAGDAHPRGRAPRMTMNIGKTLLHDSKDRNLSIPRQSP